MSHVAKLCHITFSTYIKSYTVNMMYRTQLLLYIYIYIYMIDY